MFHQLNRLCAGIVALGLLLGLASAVYADATPTASNDQLALRLNEFMANNTAVAADPNQQTLFPDWIEIYNPSTESVSLDGLFLTNNAKKPTQLALPSGLTIAPNSFIVFYADFRPELGTQHIRFSLNKGGGFLGLYGNQGNTAIDTIKYNVQYPNVSEGRSVDGAGDWRYLIEPTPGNPNAPVKPFILNLQRTPLLPTADVSVGVTTLITDNGTITATLFYTLSSGEVQSIPMVAEASMISGTQFTAQIPAQPNGTLVHYTITAQDNDNLTDRAPRNASDRPYVYKVGYQPPKLYINELMSDNAKLKFPGDATTPDWFEIYNAGPDPVDLSDYYLTTDSANPRLFDIQTGQTTIPAGGFLVFFADKLTTKGELHTNFTLKEGSGGFLGIYDELIAGFVDAVDFPPLGANISYARADDSNWQLSTCYSPGQANKICVSTYLPFVQN